MVFSAEDSERTFKGTLTYSDDRLSSWSYDIDVTKPKQGKLNGSLPENGAKIDQKTGTMLIKKIWNGEILITETYKAISEAEFEGKLSTVSGL